MLRPRTLAALARARAAGLHVIVVTGRMVQSAQRVLEPAGLERAARLLPGRGRRRPGRHLAPARADRARARARGDRRRRGGGLRAQRLRRRRALRRPASRPRPSATRASSGSRSTPSATSTRWLERPPTKLVVHRRPGRARRARRAAAGAISRDGSGSRSRCRSSSSSRPRASRRPRGSSSSPRRLGFARERTVAFGDGENDLELVDWGGYGVAVANADERVKALADWVCPSAEEEGVAQVIEALLDSRA